MGITRRQWVAAALAAAAAPAFAAPAKPTVQVWKSPTCGCCEGWIEHLEANGFGVQVYNDGNADMREKLKMPVRYGSCHTALAGGYAIEGHVPAREIHRLLKEKPAAVGLAVPGMPVGSPGMDGPEYGGRRDAFDVLLVSRDGRAAAYQSYR
jgi:hypothetical protein